jgi:hypothetical protein
MRHLGTLSTKRISFSFLSIVLVILAVCGSTLCQKSASSGKVLRPCLVVAPGGTNVKDAKPNGQEQLSYRIQSPFPADDVLHAIAGRLESLGWRPLEEDYFNPGLPSSHVRGWQYFLDATTQPRSSARTWVGQWENDTHDIVDYMLEYRCAEDLCSSTRDLHDLQVLVIYIPAELKSRLRNK